MKEKVKSATAQALNLIKGGSPSKIPALFRMAGWAKLKVLTEDEKPDVFAVNSEERREKAEIRAKAERLEKAAKDEKRKEGQNEWKQRSRANKKRAAEAENPGGKKRRKVSHRNYCLLLLMKIRLFSRMARQPHEMKSPRHCVLHAKSKRKSKTKIASLQDARRRKRSGLPNTSTG
jgi:hypothetical protein